MKTTKKALSVLLAMIMIMTSMSVCFGTFSFSAAAADEDYTQQLADKLNDSAYANTLELLGKGTKGGSGLNRSTSITFENYKNFKQAAELLRLVDAAMKETDAWQTAVTFSGSSDSTDQSAACNGKNAADVYNDLTKNLEKKHVTLDTNVTTFIGFIYHMDGATAHSENNGTSKLNNWVNTITFTTSDYQGYLAQIGKASAVEPTIELGVKYVVTMQGDLYFEDGCDKKYHHQFWPAKTAVNAATTSSTNTEAKTKVNAHINELNSFINLTYDELLADAANLDAKLADYNSKKSTMVTYVGSQPTYDALFADYASGINNFLASVQSAKDFQTYMPTVDNWNAFVAANPNYGVFQYPNFGAAGTEGHTKLLADYATFKAYRDYLLSGGSIYTYLVNNNYIDETYYTNFYDNVVAYDLQDSKDKADALYTKYAVSLPEIDGEELAPNVTEKGLVYSELCGYINAIGGYSAQVVNAVYYDGYAYLIDFREVLKCDINEAVLYFAENADKTFTELSTSALWSKIDEARTKNTDLEALYNDVKANVGSARADELLLAIKNSAWNMIENLYKTLADRFTLEVNNAWDVYVELGKPTALKVDSFLKLSAVMVAIEPAILTDLQAAGKAGYITQETIDRYNELMKAGGIYEIWNAYASTFGFPDYKKTEIKYDDRIPMEGDELKTSNDAVTEAEMNNLIAALDKIITSDLVGDLLGGLLNPDAEPGAEFDLGATLTDLIKGMLFTDDFINTVVQMLYPLVLNEFVKVWATLPNSIEYSGINVKVQYFKNLHTILDEGNFELYPDLLAQKLVDLGYGTKYADNIAMLRAAGGENDSWESSAIVDYETEKLKLTWGVAEQKEKLDAGEITQEQFDKFFYQAFEDATAGLLPLLTTLITNVPWMPAQVQDIATGNVTIIIQITLNVALQLGSTANQGYANMLVPIYELLGVPYTPVSEINGSTDVAYVLEQILKPIFTFLGELGEKPVDKILSILPNLVYALAFRMAKPMLNMLQTNITYAATANLVGEVLADGAEVKVGDMLIGYEEDKMLKEDMFVGGLNSLLANFGLNIPTIDQATLATLGSLDQIDTSRAAYIYSGLEGTGKAYSITADKADVGYYLLSYILNAVKDEATFTSLLGLFMTQKDENGEAITDADGNKIPDLEAMAGIKEVVYETLNLDEMNVGNVIAAIVELANQVEYNVGEYFWYDGSKSTPIGTTSATEIYLNPENDWTEDKAEYLYNNLEGLLNAIFKMANLDINVEGALSDAIGGLFTNKTVTALAKLLGSLSDLNALLEGIGGDAEAEETPDASEPEVVAEGEEEAGLALDINKIIKDELGIDLSVYAQYAELAEDAEIDFGVTDAETFVAALTELLTPVKPLLDFILGGKDLTLIDSAITLQGYKGYDNAIIPLLEALGATPAAYTDGADTLALTLNGLVGVINKLTTNDPAVEKDGAIYTIIDMLPGIIYYISSNALSQGVDKLLTPVYAILDTIRPIYNVNLSELLAGIEVDLDKDGVKEALGLDLNNLNWNFIFGLLNDLLGLDLTALEQVIYDVAKSIGVEYDSASALESTWKKGAYNDGFDQADMLTVVLSFVLEWITIPANGAKLDEMLGTDGIVAAIGSVFESVEIAYGTPNWMYWFESEDAFNKYLEGDANIPNTLASLDWAAIEGNNDWDLETAQYFANNIGALVDIIIGMINKDKADAPKTVAALIDDLLADYINADTINELIGMIAGLLEDIDENLIDAAGRLLDVNIVGLKAYTCTAEIASISDFINELANVLDTYAGGLINWLFFGDDYRFAKKSDNTDTIVINGGLGYEKGLALILEALGCELPAEANTKSVLGALATRVEAILADPVNEVLDLLPNLIYFLNANGAGVAVDNLLQPVYALLDKLSAFGLEVNLADLLKITKEDGTVIAIDLANLSLENVVAIVEGATDLTLDAAEEILVGFCTGKITKGTYIYKMEAAREDVITILLVVALELVSDETFAAQLDEMLGTDFIAGLKDVFNSVEITYVTPDWEYPLAENGTVDAMKYAISYPTNWNEDTAKYVTEVLLSDNFDALITGLIDSNYTSLGALLKSKVNVFTSENVQAIIDLVAGLLGDIDENLLKVGYELLDVDLVALKNHKVTENIDTVEEFAAEIATILGYAKGAIEWLLLGRDFKLVAKNADEAYITINGAEGYAEGLALLLEALGCEDLPAADGETQEIINGVLASLAARIDEILSDPIVEVIDLLPNLFYFLNANGVAAVIKNTTAAVMALVGKLEGFGIELDLNELVNLKKLMKLEETDAAISLDNLSMAAVLEAVGLMVGLDLTLIEDVLVGFALGQVDEYDSVSAGAAYKMSYTDDFDKYDLVTVAVTLALLTLTDKANEEFVKNLIGEAAYDAILNVLKIEEFVADVEKMDWIFTDKADTGSEFSPVNGSQNPDAYVYGDNYTAEEAKYVSDNFGVFVDNVIKLIGINVNGTYVNGLAELLDGLVGGGLYNSTNVVAIRDALAGLLEGIKTLEVNGVVVGDYIVEVLDKSLGININDIINAEVPEFADDKDAFIAALADVLDPLGPILNWLLTGKEIAFFTDLEQTAFVQLPGAEGYKNGIVLLLEALGCDVVDPATLDENASGAAIVTAIIEPLLDRLDVILADPANEIFAILPNLVYFINSNGVDTVVKNTLNAVYTILAAIEPIAKIDLYELIGLDLSTLTFDVLFDMLIENLNVAGFSFEGIEINALADLTAGTLETYDSYSAEEPAYRMVWKGDAAKADMVTSILVLLIEFVTTENNQKAIVDLLKSIGMTAEGEKYVAAFIEFIATCVADTSLGMDAALYAIYYVYYGVDKGASELITGKEQLSNQWKDTLAELNKDASSEETKVGDLITDIFDIIFETDEDGENGVLDDSGVATNGFLAFFQKIANFFKEIGEFFRKLFSFGK